MDKKRGIVLLLLLAAVLFAGKMYEDHRVQKLEGLISYEEDKFERLLFSAGREDPGEGLYQWVTENPEVAKELYDMVGDSEVRRTNEDSYNERLKEEQFRFELHQEGENPIIVFGWETRIHIVGSGYFEVVDEPIDVQALKEFKENGGGDP